MADVKLESLPQIQDHARKWLFHNAAQLWSTNGVLSDGMFAERLDLNGLPVTSLNRRMRVQARQIYSFTAIGILGWEGPWQNIVSKAVDILITKGRREDGLFVHLFDTDGQVINSSLDLYDHAFGLFALAHAAEALKKPELTKISEDIVQKMMTIWWLPQGGFWEGELTPSPPYRQNPHMHMFEAALINYKVSGKIVWRDLADKLGELFRQKFQNNETGAVTEYFNQDWSRLQGIEGDIVEPGHCLEWAWLFEIGFDEGAGVATSDKLVTFARQNGLDAKYGVAINEVYLDGRIKDGGARLWPQTERLKAAIARYDRLRSAEEAEEIISAYKGLYLYLDLPVKGVWRDRLNADGSWVEEAAPASSFYHIVCAINELLRLSL